MASSKKIAKDDRTYVVWNNKGGVGKTTLSFHLSTAFAHEHPDATVVVVDMCPQTNVSSTLLTPFPPSASDSVAQMSQQPAIDLLPRTVAGMLQASLMPPGSAEYSVGDWLTQPCDINPSIPTNLFLLCGDQNLELLHYNLRRKMDDPAIPMFDPWVHTTCLLKSWIEKFRKSKPDSDVVCFIDCNPAFATYTQISIAAADRLIIPVNSDLYSLNAVKGIFDLVFGYDLEKLNPIFSEFAKQSFAHTAKAKKLVLPKIHIIVNNRCRVQKGKLAQANKAAAQLVKTALHKRFYENKELFTEAGHDFADHFVSLKDFQAVGVVAMVQGKPFFTLRPVVVDVAGEDVRLNFQQIKAVKEAVSRIVALL